METFLLNLLKTSLLGSLAILAMLVLKPLWRERYRAKTRCWLWLALAVFLLLPVDFSVKNAPVQAAPPKDYTLFVGTDKTAIQSTDNLFGDMAEKSGQSPAAVRDTIIQRPVTNPEQKTTRYIPVTTILFYGYLAGAAAFLLYQGVSYAHFRRTVRRIVEDFTKIPRDGVVRPKVGIVGEILLKYHPDANNHVARHIMDEGGEPVLTDIMDFFLYCFMDPMYRWQRLGGRILPALGSWLFIVRVEMLRSSMRKALEGSIFMPVSRIRHLSHSVKGIISRGNQAGEGWLLTAEMLELIDNGATNVLCLQPFGCLPNHITGKGVMKELKRLRPAANLMAVDYDPGSSEANQLNRIKLFMSMAHAKLQQA